MALEVGTRLARREAQNDAFDLIEVVGFNDLGEYGSEVVVKSATAFDSPLSATRESLLSLYTLKLPVEPLPEVPWETPEAEVQADG